MLDQVAPQSVAPLPRKRSAAASAGWRGPIGDRALWVAGSVGLIALAAAGAQGLSDVDALSNFTVVFASVVIEALPFVLLGALVSGLIAVYVPDRTFEAIGRLPVKLQVPGAALGGFAFPVCECGSVPVARRLILRGLHPAAAVAFMLSSPILNPIVLVSTAIAYQGRGALQFVLARAGLGLVVALAAGAVLGRRGEQLLTPRAVADGTGVGGTSAPAVDEHGHEHMHDAGGRLQRARHVVDHVAADFLFMGKFVVAGGALAAAFQTVVPTSVLTGVLTSQFVGPALLMLVAFVLSLCSEADAFVAISFPGFTSSAQLAFLVFGPVLDLKLSLLYGATFGRAFVLRLLLVTAPLCFVGSLLIGMVLP